MSENRSPKPMVPDYVSDMVNSGSTASAREHTDVFIQQLIEAAPELFQQAIDVAKQDAKLRADVFTKISREVHDASKANDEQSQKVIDDASANNELIRRVIGKILEDGEISPAEFEYLFTDLRYFHNEIKETQREAQAARERMLLVEKEAAERAAKKSGYGGLVAGAIGGFIAGLLFKDMFFGRSK